MNRSCFFIISFIVGLSSCTAATSMDSPSNADDAGRLDAPVLPQDPVHLDATTVHQVERAMGKFDFAKRPANAHCRPLILPVYSSSRPDCIFDLGGRPTNATIVLLSGPFDYDSGDGFNAYAVTSAIIDNGADIKGPNSELTFSLGFTPKAGQVLLRLDSHSGNAPSGHTRVSATFRHRFAELPSGALVAALQVEDGGGAWHDRAAAGSDAIGRNEDDTRRNIVADAIVDPNTPVRLELRAAKEVSEVWIDDARLTTDDCVPDSANPGNCL